jgi:2-iminobutanoate/2-iminopropanoate deaminase
MSARRRIPFSGAALLAGAMAALVAWGCTPEAPPIAGTSAAPGASGLPVAGGEAGQDPSPRIRIDTERAPAAIGPYSQAVLVGNTLYLAGQIALDPESGDMVGAGPEGGIEAETRQVMENLGAVLQAAGFTFDQVVQSQVFLVDLDDFAAMNQVYASYFGAVPPARATVGVASLPRGARVEILMTAVR